VILTVTPNPSLDLLFEVDQLVWDDANRVAEPRRRAGGQGINVARAVRVLGGDAIAVALLGGSTGHALEQTLVAEGVAVEPVTIAGETRTFVAVHERKYGRSLLVNPCGPATPQTAVDTLADAIRRRIEQHSPSWVACCGSLPPGVPDAFYARVRDIAREGSARFVADCDGAALRAAAEQRCDVLVPNRHEAERLLDQEIGNLDRAGAAAALLVARFGVALAAITLGARGAVAASAEGVWHAAGPDVTTGSAVGAGDAFLAALLLSLDRGDTAADCVRSAVAAGTAVLLGEGNEILNANRHRDLLREVEVRRVAGPA
jgi:6-phosphofructokinase 2